MLQLSKPLFAGHLLASAVALCLAALPAGAIETVHSDLWVGNNDVRAIAKAGNTLYVGGIFTYLGPATGAPIMPAARVMVSSSDGVFAAVQDGAGGWFIGGQFFAVGGVLRNHLVHLLAGVAAGPLLAFCLR